MPAWGYVYRSVYGAWRLALLDVGGMAHFDISVEGFWRSFFAAVPVAPFYVILIALNLQQGEGAVPEPGPFVLVKALVYVLSWVVFPLAMIVVVRLLSLGANYVPFIIAYNWSKVIQIAVIVAASLLGDVVMLMAWLAVLAYVWFVTRVALQTTGVIAAGVVVFDELLGAVIVIGGDSLL